MRPKSCVHDLPALSPAAAALLVTALIAGCVSSTVRFSATPAPAKKAVRPSAPAPAHEKPPLPSRDDDDFGALLDDPVPIPSDTATVDDRLETIVDAWLGTPYRYGGMSKSGSDCSGLVCQVFRELAGMDLPRSATDMQSIGSHVPIAKVHRGDLLLFRIKRRYIDHVGIYLGNDEFIHASSKFGVVKSNIKDEYYRTHFIEARRILQ